MRNSLKHLSLFVPLALVLALFMVASPAQPSVSAHMASTQHVTVARHVTSAQHAAVAAAAVRGCTTGWSNVRTAPFTSAHIITTYAPNTNVTIYGQQNGSNAFGNTRVWYRVLAHGFIYSDLVARSACGGPGTSARGKVVIVSLSKQHLYAYDNGHEVNNFLIMSGRPALATPLGTYHVFLKLSPTTFYSPFPPGSPYWYAPTHINYALEFKGGGYFLHDGWWHSVFGPGSNGWHYDPQWGWQWGTHGCVCMPIPAAAWLYNWAPVGTTVKIVA
ncbi:MAG TPA: L,D-transpeptidase family protein [Ktedonobacteraceae bacterium]|jgi:hypothetical protein|nr:L,D-transpeptidase family protein [Ktedonobacteraceae bacterium]